MAGHDEDRPKRSWRDVDRNKDRSAHRKEERPAGGPRGQVRVENASRVYRARLDAFFDGQTAAPAHAAEQARRLEPQTEEGRARVQALRAIKDAVTPSAVDAAVRAFVAEHGELPPDDEILSQALLCKDDVLVGQALALLQATIADQRVPRQPALLEQRLRRVAQLSEEPENQERARALLREVRLFT